MTEPRDLRYTERLRLEAIGPDKIDDLLVIYRDPGVIEWYGEHTEEQLREIATAWGEAWRRDGAHKWMAYDRSSGELIGRGGISYVLVEGTHRWEIGWALRSPFWGKGYATEIGRAGLALAFDELGVDEVVAFTEPHNARSRAVMERLGMTYLRDFEKDDERFALYALKRPRVT